MKDIPRDILLKAKQYGFSDKQLAQIWKTDDSAVRALRLRLGVVPVFKTVDTCAAEFEAYTPYHYSTYESENESVRGDTKKVVILGGGPNRIGQGIEFDYCCVHGIMALREEGFEAQMINCNPETVSTDYDTTDKLYFEPLTFEEVMNILDFEKPDGVIISFGGQTPLKLAKRLESNGVKILGTSPEGIDLAGGPETVRRTPCNARNSLPGMGYGDKCRRSRRGGGTDRLSRTRAAFVRAWRAGDGDLLPHRNRCRIHAPSGGRVPVAPRVD